MQLTKRILFLTLLAGFGLPAAAQQQQLLSSSMADTWPAVDGLGRQLPLATHQGSIRPGRYVGVFYFIWHGPHEDSVSPFDITKMLAAHPDSPHYGPSHAYHHWSEPAFGYYRSDDPWVIRRHAQMLSDAGVDLIILDVTNALIYLPQLTCLLDNYQAMRKAGLSTPAFAFIVNTQPKETIRLLYDAIYSKGLYRDLWFFWKGKPLLLTPPEGLNDTTAAFFTTRHSWAWSKDQAWFADGKDKWPWLDHTPQNFGWHEAKDKPEEISVALAEHPVSNIGRSFHDGRQPDTPRSRMGLYFAEQWKRALAVDPELVFVTGWNEWIAMRFIAKAPNRMLGKPVQPGGSYFIDEYNEEYSRDAEPENGSLRDNYYYQLIDGIRRYKGTRPLPQASRDYAITIDGKFADWKNVRPRFADDAGDTFHRNHAGYGSIKKYIDNSGRNDILSAGAAAGPLLISFYVRTAAPLSPPSDSSWMILYIGTADTTKDAWEGFQYRIHHLAAKPGLSMLENYSHDHGWQPVATVKMAWTLNEMELAIPKNLLGISSDHFYLDFKWTDNIPDDGSPMHWLDKGDTAPNGRFRYRFIHII